VPEPDPEFVAALSAKFDVTTPPVDICVPVTLPVTNNGPLIVTFESISRL
jgi:hypothetical protein